MTMLNVVPGDLARRLLLFGTLLALGAVAGLWVNGLRWEARLAEADRLHASTLGEISRAAAAQLQAAQQQQVELQQRLALLDQQRYQELTHAQEQQNRLRADLAASARRMYVPVTAASSQQLPTTPAPPAWMMEPTAPNFSQRLQRILPVSPETPTPALAD